ncbi:MAG: DUF4238 domain-containing protein [Nostoc sp.]
MSQQITKNQHYIPQFLLNHFGYDVKKIKKINIFDMTRGTVRYNQAVKEVFSQNYFYDKDNSVENLLCNHIEAPVAVVINNIVNGQFSISKEDTPTLLRFISVLLFRTPEARKKTLSFIDSFFDSVFEKLLSLNGYDTNDPGKVLIDASNLVSLITIQGIIDAGFLVDLDFHIIQNNTTSEFCISDHPAFMYNWFYKDLDHPAITSLTARGLQIFLPLSPKLLICLYDPEVYKYGNKNSAITTINSADDITILNSFQIMSAESIIGFREKNSEAGLKELYRKYKNVKIYQHESYIVEEKHIENGELKTIHLTLTKQTKLSKMPSFVKIKKKSKKDTFNFCERNPTLSALHQNYREQVLKEKRNVVNL